LPLCSVYTDRRRTRVLLFIVHFPCSSVRCYLLYIFPAQDSSLSSRAPGAPCHLAIQPRRALERPPLRGAWLRCLLRDAGQPRLRAPIIHVRPFSKLHLIQPSRCVHISYQPSTEWPIIVFPIVHLPATLAFLRWVRIAVSTTSAAGELLLLLLNLNQSMRTSVSRNVCVFRVLSLCAAHVISPPHTRVRSGSLD